jgi:hypothetical protein
MGLFLGSISERVVRQAIDEFLAGGLTAEIDGELQVETQSSRYRFIDGVCFSASEEDFVGSELVGWLLESDRATAVSAWWRRGARAVLLLRRPKPEIVVTSPTRALCVEGKPARDGFATHEARFIDDAGPVDAIEEEISIEIDDTRPMRASSPMEAPRGFGMRLPSHHLPVAPHVASELGPVTLPPVRMPPKRWDAEPHAPARRWYG